MNFEQFLDDHSPLFAGGDRAEELNGYNKFTADDLEIMRQNQHQTWDNLNQLLGHKHDMPRIQVKYYQYFPPEEDPLEPHDTRSRRRR